jgi:hypothetical protein
MPSLYLTPFDPQRQFKALKFFRYEGRIISRNDPFPLEGVPERKAAQLYQTRHIGYAEEDQVRQYPPKPPVSPDDEAPREDGAGGADQPPALSAEDREALIKRAVKNNNHEKLFAKASGLAGVTKDQTKAEIAAVLVDSGRIKLDGDA